MPASETGTRPTARSLFLLFLKIGNLTFGGGMPTIAAYRRELVEIRGWLSDEQYALAFGLARVTPGTVLLAFTAAIGWELLGWAGALLGVFLSCVPAAALVVWLTYSYEVWKANAAAQALIGGFMAAAIGVMAAVACDLIRPGIQRALWLRTPVLVAGPIVLTLIFDWSPVQALGLMALTGLLWPEPEGAR